MFAVALSLDNSRNKIKLCPVYTEDKMASDQNNQKPHDLLSELLKKELDAVDKLIYERMISEYAPRRPEMASHLINAGRKM